MAGDLTFAEKKHHFLAAEKSEAAAILVSGPFTSSTKTLIRVLDLRVVMAKVLPHFFPPDEYEPGIHPTAVISASATIDPSAHIGPYVVVGANVRIGAKSALLGGNQIGRDCVIGSGTCLHPSVVVYSHCVLGNRVIIHSGTVIGADGYGYIFDQGRHRKVLQVGNVLIQDDVEIGANTTVDRATFGSTVIGGGSKIDNLVHIAHNVKIGGNCIIMGQVGIAGSTEVGDYTVVASQTGIAGHLKIGNQVKIGAKSGIMKDVEDGGAVLGVPAVAGNQAKRQWLAIQQLPDLIKRVRTLEKDAGSDS
jgi:UDP-3-O-[3-hydroxymyristoyl] glucosamine N-acyltransferase